MTILSVCKSNPRKKTVATLPGFILDSRKVVVWIVFFLMMTLFVTGNNSLEAQELNASDGVAGDQFGEGVSSSGNVGLVGAFFDDDNGSNSGSAYLFRELDLSFGVVNETAKLLASDGSASDSFGARVSLSGSNGLVASPGDDDSGTNSGAVYLFRGLDTVTGIVTESAKLIASDGASSDNFGTSISICGNSGLVGSTGDDDNGSNSGSAYLFRGLDVATGTINESAKLLASDGVASDFLGRVSLAGSVGLVGAQGDDDSGSAYVFRGLDTATGTVNESAKLMASDGAAADRFGFSVSLSGNTGLIGSFGNDQFFSSSGAAYLFRHLDTVTGTVNESAKLVASDAIQFLSLGETVSLSGSSGLVGATGDNENGTNSGSVYVFSGLDSATGMVTESAKFFPSNGAPGNQFGSTLGFDGDRFTVGVSLPGTTFLGMAFTGTTSSFTTLDIGNTASIIDSISFISRTDWIVGEFASHNQVTLTEGDSGEVRQPGTGVFIGANVGSNNNSLTISGELTANSVTIGGAGNSANQLVLDFPATSSIDEITLHEASFLIVQGELTSFAELMAQLTTDLRVVIGGVTELITAGNFDTELITTYDINTGYTTFTPSAPILGDVNMDGTVNLLDIDPFIDRVSNNIYQLEADCNQDDEVNLLDIDPFILILSGK